MINEVTNTDNPNGIFNLARRVKEDGRDIAGERCVRNDDGKIMYDENAIRDAKKAHYEHLLNVDFEWDKELLSVEKPLL